MANIQDTASIQSEIEQALNDWTAALDGGNLEDLVACCDPEILIANDRQPTKFGLQAIRDTYGPRIAMFSMKSTTEIERLVVHNDIALVMTRWATEATNKESGQSNTAGGRLFLSYRRNPEGEWKILVDMDNNEA